MEETIYTIVLIVVFALVNFGLYKYRKTIKLEEGPFYSFFDNKGELITLPEYEGKTPAYKKPAKEKHFFHAIVDMEEMLKRQAKLQGKTLEEVVATSKGMTEEEFIFKETGLSVEEYRASQNDMTIEEYRAVQNGIPVEEYRAKKYANQTFKKAMFCGNCGEPIEEGSKFCGECGNRVND